MPPKRKTAAASAATAGTSTTNPPARKRGRPPIIRNNEANVSDTQPQPKRQRMTMDDVEASQDSDPQTLSDRTHDVDAASQAQDISTDHTRSVVASDLEQKALHLPLSHPDTETAAPTDGEDDGELSTGMSKGTSESPAKKARGVAQRRGKGVLPATRSSPRKQTHPQLHTRQQQHDDDEGSTKVMNESFPRSSQPPPILPSPLSIPSSSALPLSLPTLPIQMTSQQQQQPIKRKRGRPPKATTTSTGVADSQSLINQPAATAESSEHQEQTRLSAISITATAATSERKEAQTSGSLEHSAAGLSNSGRDASGVDSTGAFVEEDEDEDDVPGIVPSQSASVSNQTTAVPDNVPTQQQQQQGIHRLPPPTPELHQATVSSGLDIPTHTHSHQHIHPHPSSLYPPSMPYPYPYAHHGTPSGHYPFTHPPHHPSPAGRPYPSSASESGEAIDYSPSFPSTVPTTPGNSFSSTYPHHSHPHPHAILDTNAPHGNPFPPPGAGHIGIPNYAQSVYAVPPPIPSPALPTDSDEHEENESQLGLASSISVNGGGKRKVVPIPSHGGKSGGRAGRGDHVACHFCRGRKLKCDGRRPTCGHCILRNIACAYDDFIRRRGPGKKEKNSKRNHKDLHSVDDADSQDQSRDQNMMLIGPDLASPGGLGVEVGARAGAAGVAGPSNQTEVLVTVPSQAQPRHAAQPSSPLPSMPSSSSISIQQQQRRRRRNAASNPGTSSTQSGTSILRFDTAGNNSVEGGSSSVGILSGLKPSAVAYAVETNERLPVNVNVGMPSVGMEYYSYHPHHQQHHPHPHPHMSMPYVPSEHTVGYYATQSHPHPHQTTANQSPPPPPTTATTTHDHHYAYNDGKDEDLDDEDGDEDASGDIDGPQIENQRQQHPTYDPHSHPHHAYAPPPPWPTEPPGAHARV